jgi:hypothetical protein
MNTYSGHWVEGKREGSGMLVFGAVNSEGELVP